MNIVSKLKVGVLAICALIGVVSDASAGNGSVRSAFSRPGSSLVDQSAKAC